MPNSNKLKKIAIAITIIIISFLTYSLIEPYFIETKEITIESKDIPPDFDGKKIVFLSDIHQSLFFNEKRTEDLVNRVNELNPDLILLGGDYVSDDSPSVNSCFLKLSKLKAPLGIYGVLGNNDPPELSIASMKNANITYIGNNGLWVKNGTSKIRIGGVGDYIKDSQNQTAALGNSKEKDFVVLVSHNPDYFPEVDKSRVDLMLSGHTHGGQITFFGLFAPITHSKYGQKYISGVKKENNTTLIISNGVGTIIAPLRFFAPPQIIVIKLKRVN